MTAALALLGAYAWIDVTQRELAHARSLKGAAYVGSAQCKHCHPSHFASFARTYHSRMTREADSASVLGAFDGRSLEYLGTTASMRRENGEYWFSFQSARDAAATRVRVERTVGSHRYQQYLARDGDIYFRLPIAWDVARKQFFHMNGAFLTTDPELDARGLVSNVDYNRHVTRWNDNCIYCHNVHPNPGLDAETGQFETQVAELGVACEACHGPGGEHAAYNSDPVRRYALHNSGAPDPSIRNPRRMSAQRSAEVCGRCHGQRITSDIDRFHREGDPFVPGEALTEYSKPLTRETLQNGEPGMFAARFWPDGSARLTAYEYQGYLQSPCRASSQFSCESCHAMHESEPAGQMRADRKGDAACTSCHTQLRAADAAATHAKHKPGSSGTTCQSCHMPDIVYGLVSIHLSHRIESPAPQLQAASGRPDACTLCHVDRTRTWATMAQGQPAPADDPAARRGLSEVAYRLSAGDPIERAVAAHALGKPGAAAALDFRRERLGLLFESAENDAYPAVRSIARAALEQLLADNPRALEQLARFVATGRHSDRQRVLSAARSTLMAGELADPRPDVVANLRAQGRTLAIEIGE
ncbi:MAG TPA: cytochrome c3 family protein [Polyangiales bacterium]|nr:cytochrome c3 family protein [Polyangiales bacterium]